MVLYPPLQLLGGLVIFFNKQFYNSISYKLLIYFVVSGTILFGSLLVFFIAISDDFANLFLENNLVGVSNDMEDSFYLDATGKVLLDDSEIVIKWGADALYSNLGYRLVEQDSGEDIIRSVNEDVTGALIDTIPQKIPMGYTTFEGENLDVYRTEIKLGNNHYYLDVVRSDLLGKLASEAIIPAILDMTISAVVVSFILFIIVNIAAIRLIVKPVKSLSTQVAKITPEQLGARVMMENVPIELVPISRALNDALDRVEEGFNQQKRFVADAAHELRTPLTILLNRIELSSIEDDELKQLLINDSSFMSRIVEQLLDLSRAQNAAECSLQNVDLISTVKSIVSMLAPLTIVKKQEIELQVTSTSAVVQADKGELSVVIKNLIENAIKHTAPNTQILITVNAKSISIEDSGEGIAIEYREKIFDRFWRANQSDRSGSGLGLAITKEILSHFDASISIEDSERLGGAKFDVEFHH